MTNIKFRLRKPWLSEVQVSEALGLNRMPTYGGLYHDQDMIGTVDDGTLSIKVEFAPQHLPAILKIAKPLP